ncbi:MAG: carboxymuconolactone decarboxylase family protein [Candidatus Izimaplasma sp.]|nr:carboxymuconolactone decarboxylase family protein [Candidatus Izimaplasma bacterium]
MKTNDRVFSIKEQLKNIYYGAKSFVLLKRSKKSRLMTKKFKERIMLAITEVNGCAMCSYIHTKISLSSGMEAAKIKEILTGNVKNVPEEEAVGIAFAQHFASSKEDPTDETIKRLVDEYGYRKAELVVAACNVITMTNGMGTSLDYLWNRIKLKKYKASNILVELFNPLLTMILFPILVLLNFILSFFKKRTVLNKEFQLSS